jgi:arylformamidase
MQCHVGTHVDAPAHFVASGKNVSDYPIDAFFGPAMLVNLSDADVVTAAALRSHGIQPNQHVLLKTKNSERLGERKFDYDHVYLARDAAEYLASLKPRSLGFDYYSVDSSRGAELPIHRFFAKEGLLVYVCLDLRAVPAGTYSFYGLPLRLQNIEGSPVRAMLIPSRA